MFVQDMKSDDQEICSTFQATIITIALYVYSDKSVEA